MMQHGMAQSAPNTKPKRQSLFFFSRSKLDLGTKISAPSQLTFVNGNTITQSRNPFDMGHITSSRQRPAFSGVLTHHPFFFFLVFIIPLSVTVGGEKAFKALYWHACEARRGWN
ncbi:hypothetical protein NW759_002396 [Fusarium solani]|nr:hypothetical protein NW759_002396 [Fusarium solani]